MTPLTLLAIATTAGALLFLAAGYFFGKSGQSGLAAEALAGSSAGLAELETLRADNQQLQQAATRSEAQQQELETLRKTVGRADALAEENRELRNAAASTLSLRSEITAMQAKVVEYDQVLAENQSLRASVMHMEPMRSELQSLRAIAEQTEAARVTIQQPQPRSGPSKTMEMSSGAFKPPREADDQALRAELGKLRAQTSQLSGLRVQNDKLRAKVAGVEALRAELKTTRDELAALKGKPEARRDTVVSATPGAAPRAQHAATLAEFVDELVERGGNHAAAVADGQGLLIAGAGDPDVQLAVGAVGAQFMTLVSRVRGFLPMGTFASLEARDDDRRVLRIRRVQIEGEGLLLTTLREDGDADLDPLVEALHRHVPELIAGGARADAKA